MRIPRLHPKLPLFAAALVVAALITAAGLGGLDIAAAADSMPGMTAEEHAQKSAGEDHSSMPGMSADEHAQMSSGAGSDSADSMRGMSADEHAHMPDEAGSDSAKSMPGMSADEQAHMPDDADGHESMPGMDMSSDDEPAATDKRPAGLVLAGFGLVNGLVLIYAAVIRRRPDALKRRQTLARVRSTPPKRTVPAPPSPEKKS